jgi:hypothetical protein
MDPLAPAVVDGPEAITSEPDEPADVPDDSTMLPLVAPLPSDAPDATVTAPDTDDAPTVVPDENTNAPVRAPAAPFADRITTPPVAAPTAAPLTMAS